MAVRLHMLNRKREIAQLGQAQPERLHAGFAVALSGKETVQLGDQAHDIARGGRLLRRFLLVEDARTSPFDFREEQIGLEVGANAPKAHHVSDALRHHQIQRQGQFQFRLTIQLQRFDPATVLEHVKQRFDLPAAAVPVNQLQGRFKRQRLAIGDQVPSDGLDTDGCIDFAGNHAGHAHDLPQ